MEKSCQTHGMFCKNYLAQFESGVTESGYECSGPGSPYCPNGQENDTWSRAHVSWADVTLKCKLG